MNRQFTEREWQCILREDTEKSQLATFFRLWVQAVNHSILFLVHCVVFKGELHQGHWKGNWNWITAHGIHTFTINLEPS